MTPLALGLISAAAAPVLDLFTGASRKAQAARDNERNQLQGILNRINGDMGTSAATSTSFKAQTALNDKAYDRQSRANAQSAAAAGLSDEARLGQTATLNDAYNGAQLNALTVADQERKRLQEQADAVRMQLAAMQSGQAQQLQNTQNQFMGGISAVLPYMFTRQNPVTLETGGKN